MALADSRHDQLIAAVMSGAKRLHRSGVSGCGCTYCQALWPYVRAKLERQRQLRLWYHAGSWYDQEDEHRMDTHVSYYNQRRLAAWNDE